ncbi:HNH endonuclease domain-containing protein [Zhengella sp. ZM62]|uniref:HNH endonuclease domain-containing protein n=1 Tax=Zhengella sedimenti TaxID=3390035 RepID=UPI00397621C2
MVLRFAFDLGTGSIGMAVSRTDGHGTLVPLFAGARILPARPDWQEARMGKRRKQARCRKRRKRRRRAFAALLRQAGLLPAPGRESDRLFGLDPYVLRAAALDRAIALHAFGRVLMHLHKRRGRLLPGNLDPQPLPARTPGEMLARRHAGPVRSRKPVRNRLGMHSEAVPEVSRFHVIRELETLWLMQQRFHPAILTEDLLEKLRAAFLDEGEEGRKAARTERRIAPALAALRHCMAALEHRFGKPDAVVIEQALAPPAQHGVLAGAALPGWGKSLLRKAGLRPTRRRRLALALMDRQERAAGGKALCPWSGKALSRNRLFSGAYEIDHVIPVSRGGNSAAQNLVLCHAEANRQKGNRLPGEFPAGRSHSRRADIRDPGLAGMAAPPDEAAHCRRKAMARLVASATGEIAARWPGARMEWAAPFAVSALRRALEREHPHPLFAKSLADNRNHALDALVALHVASARAVCGPEILPLLENATVTHAAETAGPATREMRYGAAGSVDGTTLIVTRRPVTALTLAETRRIRDATLRHSVIARLEAAPPGTRPVDILARFSRETRIRHVRVARPSDTARPNRRGAAWIVPAGNAHLDIVSLQTGEWIACGASHADVARKDWRPAWEAARIGGKLVMRLRAGDLLEIDGESGRSLRTVRRLANAKGRLYLAAPEEGGSLAGRHADPDDPFRWELVTAEGLRRLNARALDVTPAGLVRQRRSNVTPFAPPVAGPRP